MFTDILHCPFLGYSLTFVSSLILFEYRMLLTNNAWIHDKE